MNYREELRAIPELAATGEALADYAKSLIPNADFTKKGRRWVCKPNFIAFEVQAGRAKQIRFTVYGARFLFDRSPIVSLELARGGSYLQFVITKPRQLGVAAAYIANAASACLQRLKFRHLTPAQPIEKLLRKD
jgi:hypothetical protein